MGIVEGIYAEIRKQELSQNPYSCLLRSRIDLNPHQVEAYVFSLAAIKNGGAILADEVGLGKTIEAGLVIKHLLLSGKKKILLIMPSNLRRQWQIELEEKFDVDSFIVDSSNIEDYREEVHKDKSVIIVSYNFAARQKKLLGKVVWDFCVFDEAHRMRNIYKSGMKMATAIYELTKDIPKILLTATPMQNTLLDLYGLVQFIDEKLFYNKSVFSERYIKNELYDELKQQLAPVVQRTLRSEVSDYILFPERKEITVDFSLSPKEIELYMMINNYLKKEILYALPNSRRTLITSVIRKLLASSSMAVAETFEVLKRRLIVLKESTREESVEESLDYFFAFLDDELDDDNEPEERQELYTRELVNEFIQHEVDEVDAIIKKASSITHNAKADALRVAISRAFENQTKENTENKVVIFTEFVRTQKFLFDELSEHGYKGDILMFNGNPGDPTTKAIYKAWKARNYGKSFGSRNIEIKNAIVEAFRDEYKILLVTDSGSEGLNLQFCNSIINYDLPWNPQKIEQRIGRCHRYGQKRDVVVINLLNTQNEADRRVYEILSEKFQLFKGVFGASDKAIGLLESGSDFEKRITQIYQECKTSDEFVKRFNSLEKEIDRKRNKKMDELRGLITKNSPEEHKRAFSSILSEIESYKEQVNYWNAIPDPVVSGTFPKYMQTNTDIIGDGSHGYLLIGGWYDGNQLIDSVFVIYGDDAQVRKIPESLAREISGKLSDDKVTEKPCNKVEIGIVLERIEGLLYDDMCAGKVGELAANRRKMEIWLNYRKEEFLLNMRDTSRINQLQEEYLAEKNFKLKVQLKKQIEELEKEKGDSEAAFQEKMREIEEEAIKLTAEYESELLKKPSLYTKIVVRY